MPPTLSLSTSWLSHRHTDGYAMAKEMTALGFGQIELSHGIRISLVPGLLKALQEGVVRISSVHNFCPLPTGVTTAAPNLFMPSSPSLQEHDQWLRHTRRTLDFAKQVGARVAVVHLGQIDFFWLNPARKIRRYLESKGDAFDPNAADYRKLLAAATAKLRAKMGPNFARMKASIEEILPYAEERGIKLGLENREKFEELPLDPDFPELIRCLSRPGIAGYWHDAGHAQIKQRAGVIDHQAQLAANAAQTIGFHLHDVDATGRDHTPIGAGTIDFKMVTGFIRPEHVVVLEFSPRVSADEVKSSKAMIEGLLAARLK